MTVTLYLHRAIHKGNQLIHITSTQLIGPSIENVVIAIEAYIQQILPYMHVIISSVILPAVQKEKRFEVSLNQQHSP